MKTGIWGVSALLMVAGSGVAQTTALEMRSGAGHDAERSTRGPAYAASHEVRAAMTLQVSVADAARGGAVYLEFSAKDSGADVLVRVPLSSTGDAYGESHECRVSADGRRSMTFTAGLDEANFVAFSPAGSAKEIDLLLNKYLCRAMAAPFDCAGKAVMLPERWDGWQLAGMARLKMTSGAPAVLKTSPVVIVETAKRFDKAECAKVAPSDGICCVGGKTTNWHCGGKPSGDGWTQVSGDCWHQATAGSCKE